MVYKCHTNKYNICDFQYIKGERYMAQYVKCPRCDLNWIKEDEKLCDVCKAELKMEGSMLQIGRAHV